MVDGVTHNPSGRSNAEQAAYEASDPIAARAEREAFDRKNAEDALMLEEVKQQQYQSRLEATRQQELASKTAKQEEIVKEKKQQEEENQQKNLKQQKEQREQREQKERGIEQLQRGEEQQQEMRRAEAARVVDARLAQEREEKKLVEQAAREEEQELIAQEALETRIIEEKARREQLRAEENARATAELEADRLEAQREAAVQAAAIRAALAAANEQDSAELREKQRLAEEKRRKRAAFLDDMDGFNDDFTAHNITLAEQRKTQLEQTEKVLASSLTTQAKGYVSVEHAYVPKEKSTEAPQTVFQRPLLKSSQVPLTETEVDEGDNGNGETVVKLSSATTDTYGATSAAFFASSERASSTTANASNASSTTQASIFDDRPLRMPTRVGRGDCQKVGGKPIPLIESSSVALKPSLPVSKIGSARTDSVVPSLSKYDPVKKAEPNVTGAKVKQKVDPYNEEEGTGGESSISNVLTKEERAALTSEQKVQWIARQEDLGKRRKGFHGAVTYAFDGIFSWEMYGSAEAIDEGGNTYTEYLMRCQWGTTWENLQPWISARRYREFDALDSELRRQFPNYERAMPQLPGKDFFRFLEADVIDKRRQTLENYMSRVVLHLPSILRSRILSDFLGIQERLVTIKKQMSDGIASRRVLPSGQSPDVAQVLVPTISSATTTAADVPAVKDKKTVYFTEAAAEPLTGGRSADAEIRNVDVFIQTMEEAEKRREDMGYGPLNEEELSNFEEELQKLILGLQGHSGSKRIKKSSAGYRNLVKLTTIWPSLRATCQVGKDGIAFSLIPRAMQAEEDLVRLIRDFENLLATADHLAVLGI